MTSVALPRHAPVEPTGDAFNAFLKDEEKRIDEILRSVGLVKS